MLNCLRHEGPAFRSLCWKSNVSHRRQGRVSRASPKALIALDLRRPRLSLRYCKRKYVLRRICSVKWKESHRCKAETAELNHRTSQIVERTRGKYLFKHFSSKAGEGRHVSAGVEDPLKAPIASSTLSGIACRAWGPLMLSTLSGDGISGGRRNQDIRVWGAGINAPRERHSPTWLAKLLPPCTSFSFGLVSGFDGRDSEAADEAMGMVLRIGHSKLLWTSSFLRLHLWTHPEVQMDCGSVTVATFPSSALPVEGIIPSNFSFHNACRFGTCFCTSHRYAIAFGIISHETENFLSK